MTTKRKSSRVLAMMLAVFMVLSIVPMSIFTAAAADPTAVTLQNGKVALSADMTDDEVKTALFNALVTNPDGKNALDYEWEFYDNGYDKGWGWWDWAWGSIKGFTHVKRVALTDHYYDHGRLASNSAEGNWQVRLAAQHRKRLLQRLTPAT